MSDRSARLIAYFVIFVFWWVVLRACGVSYAVVASILLPPWAVIVWRRS